MNVYCGSMYGMCRKQDIINFENVHIEPHKLLKAMLTGKSAVLKQ